MSSNRDRIIEREHLLQIIAAAYYKEKKTQEDISRTLGISRSKVVQLLSEAQYRGIVDIIIDYPERWHEEAQSRLRYHFPNINIFVINTKNLSISDTYDAVCSSAADYLNGIISNRAVLSVSRGKTMFRMVQLLSPYQTYPGMLVYQLSGMMDYKEPYYEEMDLIRRISRLYGCQCKCFALPYIVNSEDLRDQLIFCSLPSDYEQEAEKVNIMFSSVSTIETWNYYLDQKDYQNILSANAVCSINNIFLDIQGSVIQTPLYKKMIAPSEDLLRNIQKRICVASGGYKSLAFFAALRSGLITTAFIDSNLAIKVLNLIETDRYEV